MTGCVPVSWPVFGGAQADLPESLDKTYEQALWGRNENMKNVSEPHGIRPHLRLGDPAETGSPS